MKKTDIISIASLAVSIIGLTLYFKPVPEIICGIGGLVLAIMGKSSDETMLIYGIRRCGLGFAILNILWVCFVFGLMSLGINLFNNH